eukprot:jgi/Botrbrau1/7185/Bobra.0300s0015.1
MHPKHIFQLSQHKFNFIAPDICFLRFHLLILLSSTVFSGWRVCERRKMYSGCPNLLPMN